MKKLKQYCIVLVLCLTVLSGCSLPGLGGNSSEDDVKITALATSESQIMSHMLRLLIEHDTNGKICLLYTSPSPRDKRQSRMPSSA